MGKVYVGQTALTLTATVHENITGATSLLMKYTKPDGSTGSFVGTPTDASAGSFEYDITSADDIDQAGKWFFWGYVTFSDGTTVAGEPYSHTFYAEGT